MKNKDEIIGVAFIFLSGLAFGCILFYNIFMPMVIDSRANRLGWMRYSGKYEKMIPYNNHYWNIHYLKKGRMSGKHRMLDEVAKCIKTNG